MSNQEAPRNVKEILAQATPEQVRWVTARLVTKSDQEAAHKVGVHPSTVSKWPNKAELDRAVNLLLQDVAEATALILKQAAPEAARALVESLRDPKTRVPSATAILDRTGFAARQQHEVDISDALAGILERLAGQSGTADD